jgi:hypothetical protein
LLRFFVCSFIRFFVCSFLCFFVCFSFVSSQIRKACARLLPGNDDAT